MVDYRSWDETLKLTLDKVVEEAVDSLKNGGVLYDVGGNVGSFTDLVIQRLPDLEVYIFEPVKEYYDHLVERFIDRPNVRAFNYALVEAKRELTISKSNHNLGWNTISEIESYGDQETIAGITLSELVETNKLPYPNVIKVDVEQSEYLFVEGCRELFKKHTPDKIVMEIGIKPDHPLWDKEKDMIEYLFSVGYKRYDYEELTETYDAVFIK